MSEDYGNPTLKAAIRQRAKAAAQREEHLKEAGAVAAALYEKDLDEYKARVRATFHGSDSAFRELWPELRREWDLARLKGTDPVAQLLSTGHYDQVL
jgi:hypothetical protein